MLVALFIFSLIVVVIASILTNAIRVQRYNLAHRELMDQTSFVMEYMTRHIRMAKKQTADMAYSCVSEGSNYQIGANSIEFVQYRHLSGSSPPTLVCTKFYLFDEQLSEELRLMDPFGTLVFSQAITSPNLEAERFDIFLDPDPARAQPLVVIDTLKIKGRRNTEIEIKTSISQRDLNF